MKPGMTLEALLNEVRTQTAAKRDFVASTEEAYRMVNMPDMNDGVAIVLQKGTGYSDTPFVLERFSISDHCHRQIAGRLEIPWKYYHRLLTDHRDLVIDQVNALFEREPKRRLLRTMDGVARGFMTDRYLRIDNDYLLANTLPPLVRGDIETRLLSSHVSREGQMSLKVLFTDESLAVDLGRTARGDAQDIVRPGFRMRNSEIGKGKASITGFFYRSYCTNGCVFGTEDAFEFNRTHLGGKILDGVDYEVFSEETQALEDKAIASQMRDVMKALADRDFHQKMADSLIASKQTPELEKPMVAMKELAKELHLSDSETDDAIQNLLMDADLTKWGAANAVTRIANETESYERANELETIGSEILRMDLSKWRQYATLKEAA